MSRPKVVTFDVYGTLAQWDETLVDAVSDLLKKHGGQAADAPLAANALDAESRRLQARGAFRSYRDILRESLKPALATAGLAADAEDSEMLLDRLGRVPAFPEVPNVLAGLAQIYRLAPISNTDDELLAGTLEGLGNVFDTIVTAEQAQAYKPNPGLFRFALSKLSIVPAELVHVAQGSFSDVAVCTALGIRVIWVNRQKESLQEGLEPTATIESLSALPSILDSL